MNDMISKSKVLTQLEIQIADCSRQLKMDLFAEDLVTISGRLDTLKEIYDDIKDMTPLQFTDSADRAGDYTKREIETASKNNCLTIKLNLAYAEIESLKQKHNEGLKVKSKSKWINFCSLKELKYWQCSNCNGLVKTTHCCYNCYYKFCPNCGAEMKGCKEK